jgi:hypothetical protein
MSSFGADKVDKAIAERKLWRAKEILRGRMTSTKDYNSELLRRYGEVLLLMGDDLEAGKMLFSSGIRHEKYELSIDLFLSRYSRKNADQFWSELPQSLRYQSHLRDFIVSDEFKRIGWNSETAMQINKFTIHDGNYDNNLDRKSWSWKHKIQLITFSIWVIIFLIPVLILGLIAHLSLIGSFLRYLFS